jgi:3',5'-cyclic AMP phosphodiesterase CpdA
MTKTTLLVLSDLHFGVLHHYHQSGSNKDGAMRLHEAVKSALQSAGINRVDGLLLLGDYLSKHEEEHSDLSKAIDGITHLFKETLQTDQQPLIGRVIAIPGNHDVNWTNNHDLRFVWFNTLIQRLGLDMDSAVFPVIKTWPVSSSNAAVGRKAAVKEDKQDSDAHDVLVVGVNACIFEQKHTAGMGLIGERQLSEIRSKLGEDKYRNAKHKIALVHHQLIPVDQAELEFHETLGPPNVSKLPSVIMDAHKLLDILHDYGFKAVLHGHRHIHAINGHVSGRKSTGAHELAVVSVGSCGSKGNFYRHFCVIEIEGESIKIRSFKTNSDSGIFQEENSGLIVIEPVIEKLMPYKDNSIEFHYGEDNDRIKLNDTNVIRTTEEHVQSILKQELERIETKSEINLYVAVANGKWIQTLVAPSIINKQKFKLHLKIMKPEIYDTLREKRFIDATHYIERLKERIGLLIKEVGLDHCEFYLWEKLQPFHATCIGPYFWCGPLSINRDGEIAHHQLETYLGITSDPEIQRIRKSIWGKPIEKDSREYRRVRKFFGI